MAVASQNNVASMQQNTSINYLGHPGYQQGSYGVPNNQPVLVPYGQPYAQPFAQTYGQPYVQPYTMGPAYSQQVYPPPYKAADYGVNPIMMNR